jgi:hypothetical protein
MQAPIAILADTTQIQLGWQAPSDTGYSQVEGYRVYWSQNDYSVAIHDTLDPLMLQYTITDVLAG